ncbi:FtsQ-type POTRA domain-containing protein [Streptococcus pneumoniae]
MTKKPKKQKEKKKSQEKPAEEREASIEGLSEWQRLNREYREKKAREENEQKKEIKEQQTIRLKGEDELFDEETAESDEEVRDLEQEFEPESEVDGQEESEEAEPIMTLVSDDVSEDLETEELPKKARKKRLKKEKKEVKERIEREHILRALPVLFFASVFFLTSLYFLTPYAMLKNITVSGNKEVTQKQILDASKIDQRDYTLTTFLHQRDYAQSITDSNPWIKETKLTYQFPVNFHIQIKENTIAAYSYSAEQYYPVLTSGEELPTPVDAEGMPESFIRLDFSDKSMLRSFIKQLLVLPETVTAKIGSVQHTPSKATPDLLTINMVDGNTVFVPLADLSKKLVYYDKIQAQLTPPSTVDMEIGIFSYLTTPPEKTEEAAPREEETVSPQEDVN